MNLPIIIAHRGASAYENENTMEAFEKAVELGADFIEFDVRKTADDILLIHHDPSILNEYGKNYLINRYTYSEINKHAKYHIPSLDEVLKSFRNQIRFDIEIKETGYEEQVLSCALKYLEPDQFIFTSFNDSSVLSLKKNNTSIQVGLLLGYDKPENIIATRFVELFPWNRFEKSKADFLAPHYKLINPLFLRTARQKHIPLFVWDVNEPKVIKEMVQKKVHGIITDFPDVALRISTNFK